MSEGDLAFGVDSVGTDAPVFALSGYGWGGLGGRFVSLCRGAPVQGPVGALVVVDLAELSQLFVEVLQRVCAGGCPCSHFFRV